MKPNTSPGSKVVPILLPQAGNSMEEGTVLKWSVSEGDRVRVGDVLFELETDKATIEVEAEAEGRIARIVVGEGETAPVKTPVAYLADSDDSLDAFLNGSSAATSPTQTQEVAPTPKRSAPAPAPEPEAAPQRLAVSPGARKAAERLGVDVSLLGPGSGPGGRILVEDVERAAAEPDSKSESAPSVRVGDAAMQETKHAQTSEGPRRTPLTKMRRAIATTLQRSKQTVPHFYTKVTVDAVPMLETLARAKARFRCSVNDLVVAAVARAVAEMPEFRSRIEADEIVVESAVGIGLAVALESGLVVPVLERADRLSLEETANRCRALAVSAQQGRLEGVGEGVFTVSNLGMHGVEEFSAIINPPESGILAVGAVREAVVVKDGAMRAGRAMTMVLSADHRVVDGVVAARFVARLKEMLEAPDRIEGLL